MPALLAGNLVKLAGYPSGKAESMGVGGELIVADGLVAGAMTPAIP